MYQVNAAAAVILAAVTAVADIRVMVLVSMPFSFAQKLYVPSLNPINEMKINSPSLMIDGLAKYLHMAPKTRFSHVH